MDFNEEDAAEDVDLTLRHVTRLFPEQLARALLPPGSEVEAAEWLETQVTSRQRRLDRMLSVRTRGARRLMHYEWQLAMRANVPFRTFEYHVLQALALVEEAPGKDDPPLIESVVVVLSGREAPMPDEMEYRTSPPDAPFCGVRFRVDAVYQRTVAELLARPSVLWLIFAPLARDATPERMAEVVEKLRAETSQREFEELAVALTVMADVDRRRRGLRKSIVPLLKEEVVVQNWIYKQGLEKGLEKGIEKGIEKGTESGQLREARLLLRRVLERRNLPLSAELAARIESCSDLATLRRWFDSAVVAASAAEALT
ncbi:MAG TPA: hypothetical protein VK459_00640 [Polyangiaceae bacterium]|nr:hypothetical protein [Polyangiaceae bacterium]